MAFFGTILILVGGEWTPLKKIRLRQLGWSSSSPFVSGKIQVNVPVTTNQYHFFSMENHHFYWENPLFQWPCSSHQPVMLDPQVSPACAPEEHVECCLVGWDHRFLAMGCHGKWPSMSLQRAKEHFMAHNSFDGWWMMHWGELSTLIYLNHIKKETGDEITSSPCNSEAELAHASFLPAVSWSSSLSCCRKQVTSHLKCIYIYIY